MSESKYHPSVEAKEALLADAAQFLAEAMFEITTKYRGLEREIAGLLTNQLGAYISICTNAPQQALADAANHLGNTDFGAIRAAHFGYQTLGMDSAKKIKRPTGNVVQIGDPRNRGKTDD